MMDDAREVLAPLSAVSRAVGEQDRAEVLTAAGRAGSHLRARVRSDGVRTPGCGRSRRSASSPWPGRCCVRTQPGRAWSHVEPPGTSAVRRALPWRRGRRQSRCSRR